ncbi:hypothetical protein [Clostridium sp. 1001271B_151109_B4]|uniref:hypothetical protein n=1 Tax=Clostridium sp. 1001271B_151109_B4 TaxID=2787148 RepID=UPI0018A93A64|nr:hypothetical protein [Clostridium sp. 1001271B_151109_B4]
MRILSDDDKTCLGMDKLDLSSLTLKDIFKKTELIKLLYKYLKNITGYIILKDEKT